MATVPTLIPPFGTPGQRGHGPTLIPNFNPPVASGTGTLDASSPALTLANNPRTDATVTATISGTVTTADTVTLTLTAGGIQNGAATFAYTTVAGDTVTTIAEGLADVIASNPPLNLDGQPISVVPEITGTGNPAQLALHWDGPTGNGAVLTASVSGSATETVTIGNSGVLAGGTGPVIATGNFSYTYNGTLKAFFYGQVYFLGSDILAAMVSQGMPIA